MGGGLGSCSGEQGYEALVSVKGLLGKFDRDMAERARKEMKKIGVETVSAFGMAFSSTIVLNLPSLKQANELSNTKTLKIPALSKDLLFFDSFPVVQAEWPFELVVTGVDHYDPTMKR